MMVGPGMLNDAYESWQCNFTTKASDLSFTSRDCGFLLWPTIETVFMFENETETKMEGSESMYLRFRDLSRFWIQRVLVPIISFVGVVGNLVTIIIMTRRQMRSSTNNYLAALAVFDMLYLMCIFILSIAHYPGLTDPQHITYWRLWPYALLLTDACSNTSVWLTVTFTIERYIAVCHPIKGKVYCTESRAKKVVIVVALICCCLTLPTPFEWTVIEVIDPLTNKTTVQPDFSDFGMNILYRNIYYWLCVFLFVFIPLVLLTIFNSFLIRSVHASKLQRNTMTRRRDNRDSSRQESRITVMLIAVVILFMACQLPTAVLLVYTTFHPQNAITLGLGNIFNFLMAINAAGNFVLYCLLSQKYRRTFLQIFCPCLKTKLVRLHLDFQTTSYTNVDDSPSVSRNVSARRSTRGINSVQEGINCNTGGRCSRENSRKAQRSLGYQTSGKRVNCATRSSGTINDSGKQKNERCMKYFPFLHQNWHCVTRKKQTSEKESEEQSIPLKSGKHTICLTKQDGILNHCAYSAV
ncbi:thyrotropin-releasing hormone receptor-like [Tachypleus tridentatus]|uniref:thyrotropin-releasing hormone receptor-like n=1 Tax=Tachypleus tridentatus TaxID=6853 RepID=UPI003FCF18EE